MILANQNLSREILAALHAFSTNVDERFNGVDQRFEHVEKRLDNVEERFEYVAKRLDNVASDILGVKSDLEEVKDDAREIKGDAGYVKTSIVTKEYLDDKIADARGDLMLAIKTGDRKTHKLVKILNRRKIITKTETEDILKIKPLV